MAVRKLTPRQELFVREYLVDLNATQAAIRAGYSPNAAKEQGARLLTNANIQAAMQEAMKARSERTEVTADMVLAKMWGEATYYGDGCSHSARVRALELCGRHVAGMFKDKVEVSGTGDGGAVKHEHDMASRLDRFTAAFVALAARQDECRALGNDPEQRLDSPGSAGQADAEAG